MNEQGMERQSREEVLNLQRYLRQLAFFEEAIKMPPVDGIFESDTEEALRNFQESRGLPVTGNADRNTWELLYEAYRASLSDNSPPRGVDFFSRNPKGQRLLRGREGFDVAVLQYMLGELSHLYSGLEAVTVNGVYDLPTEEAVRIFQAKNLIPPTGEVDLLTWNSIADQYNLIFARLWRE